jgi:hypothetical protein
MGNAFFVPLNKTVPANSLVGRAYETGNRLRGRETLDLGGIKGEFLVDAEVFQSFSLQNGTPPSRAVLSLLTPLEGQHTLPY